MATWTIGKTWAAGEALTHTALNTVLASLKAFLEGGNLDRDNIACHYVFHDMPFSYTGITFGASAPFTLALIPNPAAS